ncbi:MAG: polysaccharide deacetylase family protein [Bacteroidota bacterium]|nr:polysaccharide deacetylase family protein [Bacteroidota bacterium]
MKSITLIKNQLIRFSSYLSSSDLSKAVFYHDIHKKNIYTDMSTSIDIFKLHIQIIKEAGFEIVSKITQEKKQIHISFDDGYLGLYENLDVIRELNIHVELFISTSFLGTDRYINKSQLHDLALCPLVKISSHSHSHSRLDMLSLSNLKYDLIKSKEILEDIIAYDVYNLAYPFGRFSSDVIKIALEVGYKNQFSSVPGPFTSEVFNSVKRRSLVQNLSGKYFYSVLRGGDNILSPWYFKQHFSL